MPNHVDGARTEPTGAEPAELRSSRRSRAANALLAVSSLIALAVIVDELGRPSHVWNAVRHAQWDWVAAALAVSLLTNVAYAVALKGTVTAPIPLWPTTEVQLAVTYANVILPVLGGTALQIRFLQRRDVEVPALSLIHI